MTKVVPLSHIAKAITYSILAIKISIKAVPYSLNGFDWAQV